MLVNFFPFSSSSISIPMLVLAGVSANRTRVVVWNVRNVVQQKQGRQPVVRRSTAWSDRVSWGESCTDILVPSYYYCSPLLLLLVLVLALLPHDDDDDDNQDEGDEDDELESIQWQLVVALRHDYPPSPTEIVSTVLRRDPHPCL